MLAVWRPTFRVGQPADRGQESGGNQNGRFEIVIDMPRNSSVKPTERPKLSTVTMPQLTQRINVIQRQGARIRHCPSLLRTSSKTIKHPIAAMFTCGFSANG